MLSPAPIERIDVARARRLITSIEADFDALQKKLAELSFTLVDTALDLGIEPDPGHGALFELAKCQQAMVEARGRLVRFHLKLMDEARVLGIGDDGEGECPGYVPRAQGASEVTAKVNRPLVCKCREPRSKRCSSAGAAKSPARNPSPKSL